MTGETLCKETNKRNLAEQEKYFRSYQPREILRKTISTTVRPHKYYQSQENHRRLQHSSVAEKKEAERTDELQE